MPVRPLPLNQLINLLTLLPGVGARQAEKIAFQLLAVSKDSLMQKIELLLEAHQKLHSCKTCGALVDSPECSYCDPLLRDRDYMAVVASVRDLFTIEEGGEYLGFYHVLGNLLAPSKGIYHQHLHLETLADRIETLQTKELILAIDTTLEGDTTSHHITSMIQERFSHLKITRLAYGVPIGMTFDRIDSATLARAFSARSAIS